MFFRWLKNLLRPENGASYLIEFRFQGDAKTYLRKNIWSISRKFKVKGVTREHVVPHISLIGPFKTKKQKEVVNKFLEVSKKHKRIGFHLSGFGHFDNRVVYIDTEPSNELVEYRQELFEALELLIYTVDTDYLKPFAFHATLAFRDIERKFDQIWKYLNKKNPKKIRQTLTKVTLLRGNKILYEYDFVQRKLLNRKQALNRKRF